MKEEKFYQATKVRQKSQSPFKLVSAASAEDSLFQWYCPNLSATCWQKAHKFYIPKGLWGKSQGGLADRFGCPRARGFAISSQIYKLRNEWLLEMGLIDKLPRKRGPKPSVASARPLQPTEESEPEPPSPPTSPEPDPEPPFKRRLTRAGAAKYGESAWV